jgi:hypothetical protein
MTNDAEHKISRLRDLPLDIAPPRDLWQAIESRITAEIDAKAGTDANIRAGVPGRPGAEDGAQTRTRAGRRLWRPVHMQAMAAAAVIAALAIGIWIGRAVLPGPGITGGGTSLVASREQPGADRGTSTGAAGTGGSGAKSTDSGAWPAQYFMDAKYMRQRAELVKGLEARIAALPPESRNKVVASLKAISDSKRELEAELGKDPSNALLQELLVNTYQDEMRVLTAVHEAGNAAEGI